jgi:hypothetical protein
MNPRHAAALVLVGWYLMTPPQKYGDDPDAVPLGRWAISQSFDSARPCEYARKKMIAKFRNDMVNEDGTDKQTWDAVNDVFSSPSTKKTPFEGTKINAREFAVCVATDDPRLKEK